MPYILGNRGNSYGLVNFDHNSFDDYLLFQEGRFINEDNIFLSYKIKSMVDLAKVKKFPCIKSTGPMLVSAALRSVFKKEEDEGEVQFINANISCEDKNINDFFAINPLNRVDCIDMERSEYSITNFDPQNPKYMFDYQVLRDELKDEFGRTLNIATCNEMPVEIIISDMVAEKIKQSKIKGFLLYRSLDMTMQDRSIYIRL